MYPNMYPKFKSQIHCFQRYRSVFATCIFNYSVLYPMYPTFEKLIV